MPGKRYHGSTYEDKYGNKCVTTTEGEGRGLIRKLRDRIIRTGGRIFSVFSTQSEEDLKEWEKQKREEGFL